MDGIINVKVGGNYLSKDNKNAGVRGEANVTSLRITFDESWDNYAKTVTFLDAHGNNPVKRIESVDLIKDISKDRRTYITPIPKEPLAIAGEMTFVIDGYIDGKRKRSMSDKLVVKDAPNPDNAGEPTDPTPTQAEQLQKQIDSIIAYIHDASKAKEYVENMSVSAETLETDVQAFIEKTIQDDVVNLHFGLPKGKKGDTGDSGVYVGTTEPQDGNVRVWIDNSTPLDETEVERILEVLRLTDEEVEVDLGGYVRDEELTETLQNRDEELAETLQNYVEKEALSDYIREDRGGITLYDGTKTIVLNEKQRFTIPSGINVLSYEINSSGLVNELFYINSGIPIILAGMIDLETMEFSYWHSYDLSPVEEYAKEMAVAETADCGDPIDTLDYGTFLVAVTLTGSSEGSRQYYLIDMESYEWTVFPMRTTDGKYSHSVKVFGDSVFATYKGSTGGSGFTEVQKVNCDTYTYDDTYSNYIGSQETIWSCAVNGREIYYYDNFTYAKSCRFFCTAFCSCKPANSDKRDAIMVNPHTIRVGKLGTNPV